MESSTFLKFVQQLQHQEEHHKSQTLVYRDNLIPVQMLATSLGESLLTSIHNLAAEGGDGDFGACSLGTVLEIEQA